MPAERPYRHKTEDLHQRAEQAVRKNEATPQEPLSLTESAKLFHELRVYQAELEMQNEELRRVEGELNALLSRYFEMYDQAPVGYLTLSEQGVIREVNLTAATLLGVARKALVKQPITRFIFPEDQDIYSLHSKQLKETGTPQAWDMRLLTTGGVGLCVHLQAVPIPNGECRITLSDITLLKQAAEERATLNAKFHQAQKMETVGRLVGGVAHDINNMLTAIIGHAEIALATLDPSSPIYDDLQQIFLVGKRSGDITRQLLAFARQETIVPQVLDFNSTLESMIKMLNRLIGEDIDLRWNPTKNLGRVRMDPSHIDQILANLVVNARDAITGNGAITIETGMAEFDDDYCLAMPGFMPGKFLLLAVSDNGCGIDKETLARIYDPFFTTKPPGMGTGLGLATVTDIVKLNSGFINVDSEAGKGTTFKIYLPVYQTDDVIIAETRKCAAMPTGDETVLLVEDESSMLELVKKLLEQLGYRVLAASGPNQALQLAAGHTGEIHLLLTDVILPEMSGYDLQKRLSSLRPGLKCLFMSGFPASPTGQQGRLNKGIHFLQKPFVTERLAVKVREALEQS